MGSRIRHDFGGFLDWAGEEAADAAWWAALAWIERACHDAREGQLGRWRHYPRGELRRLRRDLARGLLLARLAVLIQEEDNEARRDLSTELLEQAEQAARGRRREQTLEAERIRLLNAAARREHAAGRRASAELTDEERYPPA